MRKIRKRVLKGAAAVICIAAAAVSSFSCKEIGLRNYIIDKVVGLEEIALDTPTINNDTPTVTWEEVQDAAGYRYQWDAVHPDSWIETTDNYFVQEESLSDGEHTLYLQVKNADGLWSPIYSFIFYIDQTLTDPPVVTGPGTTDDLRPTWTWNEVEGAVRYAYQLDSNDNDGYTGTSALSYTPASDLSTGDHQLFVRAQNSGGKWSGWGAHTVTITEDSTGGGPTDTTPPSVESHTPGTEDAVPSVPIIVSFSEAMDTAAAEDAFNLVGPAPLTDEVNGTFAWSEGDTVMTFVPASGLTEESSYTYSLTTAAADPAGNPLTAGIGDTNFTVVGLFSDTYEIHNSPGDTQDIRDLHWNGTQFACVYRGTGLDLKLFSDPADLAFTSPIDVHPSWSEAGFTDIDWNGSNYGMVMSNTYGSTQNVLFYTATAAGAVSSPAKSISGVTNVISRGHLAWDTEQNEWGVVWREDSSSGDFEYNIMFARADGDGNVIGSIVNLTDDPANDSNFPQIFWMDGHFGLLYCKFIGDYKGYFLEIPSGYSGDGTDLGPPVQVTPNGHDPYEGTLRGYWTGNELGIAWMDRDDANSLYFKRIDDGGTTLPGTDPAGLPVAGTVYTAGYAYSLDFLDIAWNGSSYGIVWSQSDPSLYGEDEVQFVSVSGSGGTWTVDDTPIVISAGDGGVSLYPKICWNGSRWCAAWDLNDSDDVYFAY